MNIGLIGCGNIANTHMRVYRNMKNARVVAVSDIDPVKARTFAEKYGVDKFFSDYVNLLEIKDLDFVDICTPTSTHQLLACDTAKFGHNILLEKPMALSTAECEKIILESKKQGVKLCVCHNQIFYPSIGQAKSMVDSGDYDLESFKTTTKGSLQKQHPRWNITPEEKGILWEVGCHPAYLQLHFLKNIKDVYAYGFKVKYPVYDNFVVLLRTPNRPYGIMEVSWTADREHTEIFYEMNSSNGKRVQMPLIPSYLFGSLIEKPGKQPSIYSDIKKIVKRVFARAGAVVRGREVPSIRRGHLGHYYLISEYMKSLENDTPPPIQAEEGKRTIKLLECIEESLNKNKIVPI